MVRALLQHNSVPASASHDIGGEIGKSMAAIEKAAHPGFIKVDMKAWLGTRPLFQQQRKTPLRVIDIYCNVNRPGAVPA
jgi:hypothetical protein